MTADATSSAPRRYIFDISGIAGHLSLHSNYSGIQRVVAMLIRHFFESLPPVEKPNMYYGIYERKTGQYKSGPLSDIVGAMQNPQNLRERLHGPITRGPAARRKIKVLAKYENSFMRFHFHKAKLDLMYLLGREGAFLRRNTTRAQWREMRRATTRPSVPHLAKVNIDQIARPGDVMVLLDSSWQWSINDVFSDLGKRGLKMRVMVYDLGPLSMPGYVVNNLAQSFALWLKRTITYADSYITISHSVREEMERFLRLSGATQPVRALPLVQSFPTGNGSVASQGPLDDILEKDAYPLFNEGLGFDDRLRALGQRPFVLCAGTIECRKNPMRLAQAWLRLVDRSEGDLPKLVFAGRMGWLVEDFKEFLRATGNLYGYIEIIDGPSDLELEFLYRNCLFLAMPSLYEGWGLPVGEALSFGKTALVSRCSSLPEVGQDLVEYCDPMSVRSIADTAWRLLETPARREALEAQIASADLRTWDDVARDLRVILAEE